ncbi:MAG: YdeI/OmpD-associated family protein [Thermoflexales bacterium]|nr:YdeI/OmpD-associated family protein [Thermoflexales bacterium]
MSTGQPNPRVDWFFAKATPWQAEYAALRSILLGCELSEDLKWGCPCYTLDGRNIVLIHGFKEYCAVLFFKGALLKDPRGILITQTENTQSSRQIRYSSLKAVTSGKAALKAYVKEAIAVEQAGLKVPMKKTAEFAVPEEFQRRLDEDPALEEAFHALTPGRQRAYLLFFGGAKQSTTRTARVEKCAPRILQGKGLDD